MGTIGNDLDVRSESNMILMIVKLLLQNIFNPTAATRSEVDWSVCLNNTMSMCKKCQRANIIMICCLHSTQSGKHLEAYELLQKAMKIEEEELGAKPERMVELYSTACTIFVEVTTIFLNLVP